MNSLFGNSGSGLLEGMNLEAGVRGDNVQDIKEAPLGRRLMMAPISLLAAEAGMEAGVLAEDFLAGFFDDPEDKYRRAKILLGKMAISILIFPISAPVAYGFSASGGILHLVTGWSTVAELNDQALKRLDALKDKDEAPSEDSSKADLESKFGRNTKTAKSKDTKAADAPQAVEQQVLNPDVIAVYGQAADIAYDAVASAGFASPDANAKAAYRKEMSAAVKSALEKYQERQAS